ncbi:helix-turn-helix domain-containing protein [Hydrogenophaga soli]|nr:helix-turn-helix transcriptional regulator [Burkholderiaceae bacterium]
MKPTPPVSLTLTTPSAEQLKAARMAAGLTQNEAAALMGYPLQPGSRGGLQSRTWQAFESPSDERNMPAAVFALFLLMTGQHADFELTPKGARTSEVET